MASPRLMTVFVQTTTLVPIGPFCVQSRLRNGLVPDGVPITPFLGLDLGSTYRANACIGPLGPTGSNQKVNSAPPPKNICSGRTVYKVPPPMPMRPGDGIPVFGLAVSTILPPSINDCTLCRWLLWLAITCAANSSPGNNGCV